MSKKVALILSGCGHMDGAEITEAVSLNICLLEAGFEVAFFAPDRLQRDTVNHITRTEQTDTRNILIESARIARGAIESLEKLNVANYEAIVLAGGFGAVKNFTNFLEEGSNACLKTDIGRVLTEALTQRKALVGICAAPLMLAMAVKQSGNKGQQITFGTREQSMDFLSVIEPWGVEHIETAINQCHVDTRYRLVTGAAYMYDSASALEVFAGARAAVQGLLGLL